MSTVSVNLLTFNGEKYLNNCFQSLLSQSFFDFQVIVIDNNSSDSSLEIIKKFQLEFKKSGIDFKLVLNKKNIGFACGHNQGIEMATNSRYILPLNQDVVLDKDYLKELVSFMEKNKNCAGATGKIFRLTNGEKTDIIDSLGLKLFKSFQVADRESGKKEEKRYDQIEKVFGVSATCPLYRKKALESIKLGNDYFDSDFKTYKEDVDLAFRLSDKGWSFYYVPSAIAWHKRSAAGKEKRGFWEVLNNYRNRSFFINYYSYRNHLFLLVKNLKFQDFLKNFPFIFWYEIKKFIFLLFWEPRVLKAWGDFFKKLPKMLKKRKNMKFQQKDFSG